jgi:hypothetical protein
LPDACRGSVAGRWAEATENGARVLTAVRWTPHEISLVPTPADPGAHIRMETEMTETTTREAADTAPATVPRAEANAEIRSIARIAGLDQSWIDGQIDGGADPDTARRAAFEALARRSAPAIRTEQVRVEMGESQDDPALRARQMSVLSVATVVQRLLLSSQYTLAPKVQAWEPILERSKTPVSAASTVAPLAASPAATPKMDPTSRPSPEVTA